ncbi:MAG: PCRF domain-containing protein, partial [Anaerolinea sp.]|nr:PCRF domain-containing protein [Anaerolinea sp.]
MIESDHSSVTTGPIEGKNAMFDRLAAIEARYDELEQLMADPAVMTDYARLAEISKERANLTEIVETLRQYRRAQAQLDGARELIAAESDPELRALAEEEVSTLETTCADLENRLRILLVPKDPRDDKN